jgi:hypothetical protein
MVVSNMKNNYKNFYHFHKNIQDNTTFGSKLLPSSVHLKKEAVCFQNTECCLEYFYDKGTILINFVDNTHKKIIFRVTGCLQGIFDAFVFAIT